MGTVTVAPTNSRTTKSKFDPLVADYVEELEGKSLANALEKKLNG
jgi:hypothetical protein